MATFEQGDVFDDEEIFDDDTEAGEGSEVEYDEESELEIETYFGVPKKIVYLAGAALLVVIIFVTVIAMWVNGDKSYDEDDYVDVSDYPEPEAVDYPDPEVIDTDYPEPEVIDMSPVTIDSIQDETRETLRGLGWTADEIELTLSYGFDDVAMIDHARELRDKEAEEAWKRMSNQASEEFQGMLYYTYLGQPEVWNPEGDLNEISASMSNVKINADYVKCPTRGHQLWLKCKIATDTYVFYQCPPSRWLTLPDEGNIVLDVSFWHMNGSSYVTGISESDSTLNSIDSGHSYQDITDDNPGDGMESSEAEVEE